jgi:hypothetical protein
MIKIKKITNNRDICTNNYFEIIKNGKILRVLTPLTNIAINDTNSSMNISLNFLDDVDKRKQFYSSIKTIENEIYTELFNKNQYITYNKNNTYIEKIIIDENKVEDVMYHSSCNNIVVCEIYIICYITYQNSLEFIYVVENVNEILDEIYKIIKDDIENNGNILQDVEKLTDDMNKRQLIKIDEVSLKEVEIFESSIIEIN